MTNRPHRNITISFANLEAESSDLAGLPMFGFEDSIHRGFLICIEFLKDRVQSSLDRLDSFVNSFSGNNFPSRNYSSLYPTRQQAKQESHLPPHSSLPSLLSLHSLIRIWCALWELDSAIHCVILLNFGPPFLHTLFFVLSYFNYVSRNSLSLSLLSALVC